ncbi:MAG: DUF6531 domain-containing protein [Pyrinomonadaceae bacterium]
MAGPEDTQPSTTPDQNKDVYGTSAEFETEMKSWSDGELESFWRDIVNVVIKVGEEVEPYTSPSGDRVFEDKVNKIIQDYLAELSDQSIVERDVYNHSRIDNSTNNPSPNVAQGADPVNLFNGDFVYSATDFQIDGAGMDFVLTRTYSQLTFYNGPFGFNWDHSYNLWLRVDPAARIIHRSNGALREELYRKHEQHDYWIPPDGATGIILENGDSFILKLADGSRIVYQPHPSLQPSIHLVARLEDRFGNHINFFYADGLLIRAQVNRPDRVLDFQYDTQNRITSMRDFSGRTWKYDYDDLGDLVAVTKPATSQYRKGLTTSYEYTGALNSDINLQHNLISIIDADGQLYLENEYGSAPNLLSYGRVVRQRQGNGDIIFDYADVIEDFDFPYEIQERPTHQTIVTERDGRQARYLFNSLGNMLFKEEYARIDGLPKLVSYHYRYNRDGNLVATISPLGVITQALYGRDIYERQFPPDNDSKPETDPNLTSDVRLRFNNLLAVVRRGRYHDVNSLNLAGGLWSSGIFPDVLETSEEDAIQKFTYEPEFSQPLTISDPRFTRSADPAFAEDAEHQRRLTRYSYSPGSGFQHMLLESVQLPTPILPDGTLSAPVITRFAEFDDNGRIIRVIAANGLETRHSYSQPAEGILEGFLKTSTIDPASLEIRIATDRDELGRVVRSFQPRFFEFNDERFFSTYEYNELDQVVRSTSTAPFSINIDYSYDRAGNVSGSELELKNQTNEMVGTYVVNSLYDQEFNLIAQQAGDQLNGFLKRTKIIFDRASRPFLSISPSGRKRKIYFNERSLVSKIVEDYGGVHTTVRFHYDADGRFVRVVDPRGSVTRFVYDSLGRVVDAEDPKGNRIIRHYDKVGNLSVECLYEKLPSDEFVLLSRREFSYDELGRMIIAGVNKFVQASSITANQLRDSFRDSGPGELLTIQYFYDNAGNLFKQLDQDGRAFISEFDILGRLTREVDPIGNETSYKYDKHNNVIRIDQKEVSRDQITNDVNASRFFADVFQHDELNRVTEERNTLRSIRYEHDSRGNLVRTIDALGSNTANTFDVFGRLKETTQQLHQFNAADVPIPVTVRFNYDLDDNKISQEDPLGRVTRFEYDTLGRLTASILPDGSTDSITYDRSSNLIEYHDRNNLIKRLTWDELNRNVTLQVDRSEFAGEVETEGATVYSSKYDALGRLKQAENDFVINSFTYNSLSHRTNENTSFKEITGVDPSAQFNLQREFSNSGALVKLTYPSGREIGYSRDVLDRVVKVEQIQKGNNYPGNPATPDSLVVVDIEYDGLQRKKISRNNGAATEYEYDFEGRTAEIKHSNGQGNILTLQCYMTRPGICAKR